ncbi:hypothetical protein AFLA_012654 [Aspergillus flavus NRRL3357]|nr:hypothetical protein AFLA_012654 [Aspergillus flavus NRRL3357]
MVRPRGSSLNIRSRTKIGQTLFAGVTSANQGVGMPISSLPYLYNMRLVFAGFGACAYLVVQYDLRWKLDETYKYT